MLARHRAEMYKDMGELAAALYDPLVRAARAYFSTAIPEGRYVGWVAELRERPGGIVGGAGLQLRELLPRPHGTGERLLHGPQALILNVFTEQPWRRQGVAARLMEEALRWASARGIESIVLHASAEGRLLYERLGFVPTNEMRFQGKV